MTLSPSLRTARFEDHWRHIYKRNYTTRFTSVSSHNLICLADSTIEFSGGITAIVGGNGVGKSTLVAAVSELLSSGGISDAQQLGRVAGSCNEGIAYTDNDQRRLRVEENTNRERIATGDGFEGAFRSLDPSDLANRTVQQVLSDGSFNDLLEPVTPLIFSSDDRAIASYIVGKIYSEIKVFEISDYAGFERFPYLKVKAGGVEYGSENMGRGELSLLLTFWTLRDLPKDSILILEEPETHVSPRSQSCLMNIVAKFCDEQAIWAIVTTHSPTVIKRIPQSHLKVIVRQSGPLNTIQQATATDVMRLLGGGVILKGLMVVEDEGAKGFLEALIDELAPDLLPQFEIIIAGSDSDITKTLDSMPGARQITLIGVYDGDMRQKLQQSENGWQIVFLPCDTAPDCFLQEMAYQRPGVADAIAKCLHKSVDQISWALNVVEGIDHHDFVQEFAANLNQGPAFVRRNLVHLWLNDESNAVLAGEFLDGIIKALEVERNVQANGKIAIRSRVPRQMRAALSKT